MALVTILDPDPEPEIVMSDPSVLNSTLLVSPPNLILLSDVGNFISPYTVRFLGSVVGLSVPTVKSPSGTLKSLVTFNEPIACVSMRWAPVKKVNSVNATCPPV